MIILLAKPMPLIRADNGQRNCTNVGAIYNITTGTSQDGAPQYSQGIQLDTSTVGYSNISFNCKSGCTLR